MKTIKVKLSQDSIDNAIDEISQYREDLETKLKILVGRLVQDGVQVANAWVGAGQGDSKQAYVDYQVNPEGDIVKASIFLQGKDALFIEFGAGIYYNNGNAHPKAAEFGYGVGTYPSEHPPNRAINPGYWWYGNKQTGRHFSLGTEATMPMYHAAETVRNNLIYEAVEVILRG